MTGRAQFRTETTLVLTLLLSLLAPLSPALAQQVDTAALRAECEQIALRPASQAATRLAEVARTERASFERENRTRIRESEHARVDDGGAADVPGIFLGSALAWQKVYNYYAFSGVDRDISIVYELDANGRQRSISARDYRSIIGQAFPGGDDNAVTRRRLEAPLQQLYASALPWSAAFISSLVATEFSAAQATRSIGHWAYIDSAVTALARQDPAYVYVGCDPTWVRPRVGDIICVQRERGPGSFSAVVANAEANLGRSPARRTGYTSHCDLVTETHFEATRRMRPVKAAFKLRRGALG